MDRRIHRLQAERQQRGDEQRQCDAGDARRPAEAVEDLAEDGAADEAAEE